MTEEWRWIPGLEGKYKVSNQGRIHSCRHLDPLLIKPYLNHGGYPAIRFVKKGDKSSRLVHRIVAQAFIPNPSNHPIVHHRDGNRQNACVSNLQWVTSAENLRDAYDRGTLRPPTPQFGEAARHAKLTAEQVQSMRSEYEKTPMTYETLGQKYGVSGVNARHIIKRKYWKHV